MLRPPTGRRLRHFQSAPYHGCADPFARVLGYVDFRKLLVEGELAAYTCLAGTMIQEVYGTHPDIRDACAATIFDHAATLGADLEAAMKARGIDVDWTPASLARHMQAALQGAFVLAKAAGDRTPAIESIEHLRRYLELLFKSATPPRERP